MNNHKICIPRGTHEKLLKVAVEHQLEDLPIGLGGPNIFRFRQEKLHLAIALLQPLSHIAEVQALIKELKHHDEQFQPPVDRLFEPD